MRLLVAVSNEPLAHAIHGALLAGRHEVSLASELFAREFALKEL